MKRFPIVRLAMLVVTAMLAVAGYYLFTGPHMIDQQHIRSFQTAAQPLPQGVVPFSKPTAAEPPAPADAIAAGRTYYGYYCLACHGAGGDGRGPVGESFSPAPADLREHRYGALSIDELVQVMLTCANHGPVMETTILPRHRRYIAIYIHSLSGKP
jgi:hypothetical protein